MISIVNMSAVPAASAHPAHPATCRFYGEPGMSGDDSELLTTSKVAKLLSVSQSTVERWIVLDRLKAIKLPSGHYRVRRSEVNRILRDQDNDG
jgi:excisionase family DNA binding protein